MSADKDELVLSLSFSVSSDKPYIKSIVAILGVGSYDKVELFID